MTQTIPNGKYQHYKGQFYTVIGMARNSETEEWYVIYKTDYGDFSTWIRPLSMFTEMVDADGKKVPRFVLVADKKSPHHKNTFQTDSTTEKTKNNDILNALNNSLR
ncbi:MAG: DUF1653 domain-containing protein [Ostreibacterium sp.]